MAELTVQSITEDGLAPTYDAADADGDTFVNDSSARVFLHVKNDGASSVTVTVALDETEKTVPGFGTMTKDPAEVDVADGDDEFIGPFPITAYGKNPEITYSDETDITIAALKV